MPLSQIFFIAKNSYFFGYWVEERQIKDRNVFQNYYYFFGYLTDTETNNLNFTGRSVEALGFLIPMFDSPPPKGYYLIYAYEHILPNEFVLKQNLFPKFVFWDLNICVKSKTRLMRVINQSYWGARRHSSKLEVLTFHNISCTSPYL